MFVTRKKYLELERDFREVADKLREARQNADFYLDEVRSHRRNIRALQDYCADRAHLKNVSRPAVLSIVAGGTARAYPLPTVAEINESMPLLFANPQRTKAE